VTLKKVHIYMVWNKHGPRGRTEPFQRNEKNVGFTPPESVRYNDNLFAWVGNNKRHMAISAPDVSIKINPQEMKISTTALATLNS